MIKNNTQQQKWTLYWSTPKPRHISKTVHWEQEANYKTEHILSDFICEKV